MRDEEWRNGTNTEHLSDCGLKVGQISSVAKLRVPFPSNPTVQLLLNLFLNLEFKKQPVTVCSCTRQLLSSLLH